MHMVCVAFHAGERNAGQWITRGLSERYATMSTRKVFGGGGCPWLSRDSLSPTPITLDAVLKARIHPVAWQCKMEIG